LLIILALAASCQSGAADTGYILSGGEKIVPEYVMTVDGIKVPFDEYRYVYMYMRTSYDGGDLTYWDGDGSEIENLKKSVDNYCTETCVMKKMAEEKKLSLTEEETKNVEDYLAGIISSYSSKADFEKDLASAYMSEALYRRLLCDNALSRKLYDCYYGENGENTFSDEEYIEYYDSVYYCAKQILVYFRDGENFESCEESKAKIDAAYEKLQNGADFDEVMKEYGEDESMTGDRKTGYHFKSGEMITGFYDAAVKLDIGEYSEPVMTTLGFHIILRCPIDPEVRDSMKEEVLVGYYDDYNNWNGGYYEERFYDMIRGRVEDGVEIVFDASHDLISPYTMK